MQTIYLDISNKGVIPTINAKQGDVGRKFLAVLSNAAIPYVPSIGVSFSVWYSGASGEGNYSSIGDRNAVTVEGNTATVELITQMLVNAGEGVLCVIMNGVDGSQIGSWNIPYSVQSTPGGDSEEATQYYTAFSEAVSNLPRPDESLTISGAAADAKAVGDALAMTVRCEEEGGKAVVPNGMGLVFPREEMADGGVYTEMYDDRDGVPTFNFLTCDNDLPVRVGGLADPASRGQAVPLGYLQDNYAKTSGIIEPADEDDLDAELTAIFDEMAANSVRMVTVRITDNTFGNMPTLAIIHKGDDGSGWCYGTVTFVIPYDGTSVGPSVCRMNYDGVDWSELEWENPDMEAGVEYRLTERHRSQPVYAQLVYFGALPNTTERGVKVYYGADSSGVTIDPNDIVDILGRAYSTSTREWSTFPFVSSGAVVADIWYNWMNGLVVRTKKDLSDNTAWFTVRYTKERA